MKTIEEIRRFEEEGKQAASMSLRSIQTEARKMLRSITPENYPAYQLLNIEVPRAEYPGVAQWHLDAAKQLVRIAELEEKLLGANTALHATTVSSANRIAELEAKLAEAERELALRVDHGKRLREGGE